MLQFLLPRLGKCLLIPLHARLEAREILADAFGINLLEIDGMICSRFQA